MFCRFSPLLQKIKAPEHQLRLEDEHDESDNHIQLPSLPRQRSWKDDSDIMSNGNSAATSISWSQEADAAIQRLEEQWTSVEKSFYEEDDQQLLGSILDECIQWRTQIPYLRLIGRNSVYSDNSKHLDLGSNDITTKKFDDLQNDELMEYNLSAKVEVTIKGFFLIIYIVCNISVFLLFYAGKGGFYIL